MNLDFSLVKYYISGSILFLIIVFFGEFFFSFNFEKKNKFYLRLLLAILAIALISSGLSFAFFVIETTFNNVIITNIFGFFLYLTMFLLTVLGMIFCYKERFSSCLVSGVMAYASQNIYYNIYSSINYFGLEKEIYNKTGEWGGFFILVAIQIILAAAIQTIIYFVLAKNLKKYDSEDITKKNAIFISISTIVVVLLMNSLLNICVTDDVMTKVFCRLLLLICCLFMLFFYVRALEIGKNAKNLEMLSKLNEKERKNYEKLKDNMHMVNVKCHDIKHFIQLEKNNKGEINTEELEKIVNVYDESIKSGNEVIDVILSEKKAYSEAHNIDLKISADASNLDFINVTDMCSLFGNMMENALEAVIKIDEKEKRKILVTIKKVAGQAFFCVENTYANPIKVRNGLPLSSKGDTLNHGFGISSIKMIAEKYKGTFTYESKDETFLVCVLIPMQEK